jgi:hypothetical protein
VVVDLDRGAVEADGSHPGTTEPGGQADVVGTASVVVPFIIFDPPRAIEASTWSQPAARSRPAGTVRRVARWGWTWRSPLLRYAAQRIPVYRRDRGGSRRATRLRSGAARRPGHAAAPREGIGPLFHRSYWIFVTDETLSGEELISYILEEPNQVTPTEMASFETMSGEPARDLEVGDELIVRLPGPWNGPVRVIERTPTSFRFATLRGHMEAGEIEFRTSTDDRGFLEFRIESWARSGDPLFHLLYGRLLIGRELQQHMWAQFCRRVARSAAACG